LVDNQEPFRIMRMMTQVYLDIDHVMTDSYSSDEEWGDWRESYDFSVNGASLTKKPGMETEYYGGGQTLEAGDTIYVIVACWSTGDSFGHADRSSHDVCIINKEKVYANQNLGILNKADEPRKGPLKLFLDDGAQIQYSPGWTGYFEILDSLEIYEFTL
jgi:hypothetical protein